MSMELVPRVSGLYRDVLLRNGRVTWDSGWRANLFLERGRSLLAALVRGDPTASGIDGLLIGRGLPAWDAGPIPPPQSEDLTLVDPSPFELPITVGDIDYLDQLGAPSASPTNRIQMALELGAGVPPIAPGDVSFPMREFGLFGVIGPDRYLLNSVHHGVIHKGPADVLRRTLQLRL